jgi:hypothetical protein
MFAHTLRRDLAATPELSWRYNEGASMRTLLIGFGLTAHAAGLD